MSKEVAQQTVKFISEHIGERDCLIQWFGGEPLMNTEAIDIIAEKLNNILGNDKFYSMMVTNGSLINSNIIKKMLNSWNVHRVQISLDGAHQAYERRKKYIDINTPFEIVLNNINNMLQAGIRVYIRINYDQSNYRDIPLLLDILKKEFNSCENLKVYAEHLFGEKTILIADKFAKEEWFFIQKALIEYGFTDNLEAFRLERRKYKCFACSHRSFVILPDGNLLKCTLALGKNSAYIGNIWNGIERYENLEKWCDTSLAKECISCKFLPICMGGCQAGFLGYGAETCFSKREFIDDILRERLKYL